MGRDRPQAESVGAAASRESGVIEHAGLRRLLTLVYGPDEGLPAETSVARLDRHVYGGARVLGWVLVVSLLGVHLPRALLAHDTPAEKSSMVIVVAAILASLALWWARRSSYLHRGEILAHVVLLAGAGSLLASAALPPKPTALEPHLLLMALPIVMLSGVAWAPARPLAVAATAAALTLAHLALWKMRLVDGSHTFHVLALSFTANTAIMAPFVAYFRRQALIRLYESDAELRGANVRLHTAVERLERTQQDLAVSERMATLSRVTAGLAHEMNTPLAAIRNTLVELTDLADELGRSAGDPRVGPEDLREIGRDVQEAIDIASAACGRASSYVSAVMGQTRTLREQRSEEIDLGHELGLLLGLLRHRFLTLGTPVELDAPEEVVVRGDPGRLSQAVANLLHNALDAVAGQDDRRVRLRVLVESSGTVIRVSDNGPGIPHDVRERVFDPLFTTKRPGEGTGLGLAVARDIVQGSFGGDLYVEDTPGGGATFVIRLGPPVRSSLQPPERSTSRAIAAV